MENKLPWERHCTFSLGELSFCSGKLEHTHTKIRLQLKSNYKYITILDTYPRKIQQGTVSERQCVTVFTWLLCELLTVPSDLECVLNNAWQPFSEQRTWFISHDGGALITPLAIYSGGWHVRNIKPSSHRLLNKLNTAFKLVGFCVRSENTRSPEMVHMWPSDSLDTLFKQLVTSLSCLANTYPKKQAVISPLPISSFLLTWFTNQIRGSIECAAYLMI